MDGPGRPAESRRRTNTLSGDSLHARVLAALLVMALLGGLAGPPDHSSPIPPEATVKQSSARVTQGATTPVTTQPRVDCRRERCVALTYDDGPGLPTPRLLDVLERHRARATFFVVGEMVRMHPGTTRRIGREGHAIGVHTWHHSDLSTLSARKVRDQLSRTAELIRRVTGTSPTLMRPPYGASNRLVRRVERQLGLTEIMWDVDTADWLVRSPVSVRERALRGVRRNSVVLMHDIRPTTVDATGSLIRALRRRGFRLVTVPELLGPTRPGHSYYDWRRRSQVVR